MTFPSELIDPDWYLMDTSAAAKLAHVQPGTIRMWHHRGKIRRHGTVRRARYDIREVLALAHGHRHDAQSLDT